MIPPQYLARSQQLAASCEIMLVVGTSATVQPAAAIPLLAKERGARVIEINPEPTPLTKRISDFLICGQAGAVVQELVAAVDQFVKPA
jgi:NAD-dependent deacetylase